MSLILRLWLKLLFGVNRCGIQVSVKQSWSTYREMSKLSQIILKESWPASLPLLSSFCSILLKSLFIVVLTRPEGGVGKVPRWINKVLKHAQTNLIKFKSYQNSLSLLPLLALRMTLYLIAHRCLRLGPQSLFLDG